MVDVLLRQREDTGDPTRASAALAAVLGSGQVRAEGTLAWDQRSLVDDGVSVSRVRASAERVLVHIERSPDLAVVVVRDGAIRLREGDRSVELEAGGIGLLPLGRTAELDWHAAVLDLFAFPLSSVVRLLHAADDVELHAPRLVPRSAALAGFWDRLALVLAGQVLDEVDLYARDLLRGQMVDALVATTIEAFDLADVSADDDDHDAGVIRRAAGFMRDHLGEPISIADAARAAGVSIRGLQLVFQRRLDETPLAHLRRMRLTAARHTLLVAPAGSTSVAAVARRYGYTNPGRFGTHYRSEFGESPAATLRRATPA